MRLKNINGSYSPSFFNIVLETNEDISLAVQKYTPTFVHEFIHYIQDLLLPYSLRLNFTRLSWFLRIRESADENGCIKLPFNDWDNNERVLLKQLDYTMGKGSMETGFVDEVRGINLIEQKASDLIEIQGRKFTLYMYNILINDRSITYNLGARDILEYIAYKIEVKHYQTPNMPDLPYKSIDLLFEHYGLSYVSDDIRLCIVEFCLYNDNPIHYLFTNFLNNEEFKRNIKALTYDSIYKILLAHEFETKDGIKETLSGKFNRRLEQFVDILSEQYIKFDGIRQWILHANNFVKSELNERFIFSDMHRMNQDKFEAFINTVITKIGIPLVMNNREECISIQPEEEYEEIDASQFIHFYILQEFLNSVLYTSNMALCPVNDFCIANGGEYDERCSLNPRAKIINQEYCHYIGFLRAYGLSNVEIN